MNEIKVHKGGEFHWVGNGFPVRSIFSYNDLGQELSPFLLLDYAPPYEFPAGNENRGVGAHPHRGFETVTLVFKGELEHRDSSGGGGIIKEGDVQWMTAAGGIIHEEFHTADFVKSGGTFHVAQLWVNLPAKDKDHKPGYQNLPDSEIPRVTLSDNGASARVISGELNGVRGLAKTFTRINLWDVIVPAQTTLNLPLPKGDTKSFLVIEGSITTHNKEANSSDLVIVANDANSINFIAGKDSRLLVMSGEPIDEPIVAHGPFVMNSEGEIKQAFLDYHAGKFGDLI